MLSLAVSLAAAEENKKGIDYIEWAPGVLIGAEITPINDEIPTELRSGLSMKSTLFLKPNVGVSLQNGVYYNYKRYQYWQYGQEYGFKTSYGFDYQVGIGINTYRISKRSGKTLPFNFNIDNVMHASYDPYYAKFRSEMQLKFDFQWGVQKQLTNNLDYNLLFYVSCHMFDDSMPYPMPGFGVIFQPIFRTRFKQQ